MYCGGVNACHFAAVSIHGKGDLRPGEGCGSKMNTPKLLGILGGLGPMSSAYLYEYITAHTKVSSDQEHIDIILSSRSSTPDRTAFITGERGESPLPVMIEDARRLEKYGAEAIIIACNTAHYFIDEVRASVNVPSRR